MAPETSALRARHYSLNVLGEHGMDVYAAVPNHRGWRGGIHRVHVDVHQLCTRRPEHRGPEGETGGGLRNALYETLPLPYL